jgi:hypothetical protein
MTDAYLYNLGGRYADTGHLVNELLQDLAGVIIVLQRAREGSVRELRCGACMCMFVYVHVCVYTYGYVCYSWRSWWCNNRVAARSGKTCLRIAL